VGLRKMEDDEMAEFLARPFVAVIAVDEPGWSPHVTPVWFHHLRPENRFLVMTMARSKKVRLHRNGSGELSLCIQANEGVTAKYVNVQGVARLHPLSAELLKTMVDKYLPVEYREAYIANPPEDSMFDITPRRIITGVIG
jgi:nitroimidazol reductase NimA-like FMN-containing flavoprotein (pyridoxamine 5'-phosphate oxidase superfamily)